ncbi:MAG TPA: Hsp70 family protein [Polyangiaceae bacterium]|nr:Hsp70 family protein [Polyangiaceae bacterium]
MSDSSRRISADGAGRAAGVFRVFAADDAELARILTSNTSPEGIFLPNPQAPPVGTAMKLEALTREGRVRICAADVLVVGTVSEEGRTGMLLQVVRVEVGCGEDVRHALERAPAPPPPRKAIDASAPVVGIDLGTTYTCAAIVENGEPKVIRSRLGYNTIPSMVTFDDQGLPVAGHLAERRMVLEPENVVYGSKRIIGRTYTSSLAAQLNAHVKFGLTADPDGMVAIKLGERVLSPTEIAACILAEIKKVAESELRRPVTRVVVTVPAAFTENQRSAVRTAAQRAGLDLMRIVNEPTAAGLVFGHGSGERKKILVFDLGGGTFDVSILSLEGSVYRVLATAGDMFLGGVDIDNALAALLRERLTAEHGDRLGLDRRGEERILAAARELKHTLSEQRTATASVPNLRVTGVEKTTIDVNYTVKREEFEARAKPVVERTMRICDDALAIAGLKPRDIDDVLLVGGQTRMPFVIAMVEEHFGRKASKRVHPDEVVALGAAILATMYDKADAPVLSDVLPLPIGIAEPDGLMKIVLARNATLPAEAKLQLEAAPGEPLEVAVFQGDAQYAKSNEFLGAFTCPVAPLAASSGRKAGEGAEDDPNAPQKLEVTFSLSNECILTVTTKNLSTGLETTHELTTQQTSDEVLERLGRDRVGAKLPPKSVGARPPPSQRGVAKPKATGFWAWLMRLFGRE